jgi:ankyrin repeat protein
MTTTIDTDINTDIGLSTIARIREALAIEEEFVESQERGFDFWLGFLAQRVWVSEPSAAQGDETCTLHFATDVLQDFDGTDAQFEFLARVAPSLTMSGITFAPQDEQTIRLTAAVTVTPDTQATIVDTLRWLLPLQGYEAHWIVSFISHKQTDALGMGNVAISGPSSGARRAELHPLLNVPREYIIPFGKETLDLENILYLLAHGYSRLPHWTAEVNDDGVVVAETTAESGDIQLVVRAAQHPSVGNGVGFGHRFALTAEEQCSLSRADQMRLAVRTASAECEIEGDRTVLGVWIPVEGGIGCLTFVPNCLVDTLLDADGLLPHFVADGFKRSLFGGLWLAIHGVSPSRPQPQEDTPPTAHLPPVVAAIETGDLAALRALIDGGLDVNAPIERENELTPIFLAAIRDKEDALDLLLGAGADPNQEDLYGATPLIAAAEGGSSGCVRRLLAGGAKADKTAAGKRTALTVAIQKGFADVVAELLAAGADPNAEDFLQQSLLSLAAKQGNAQTVTLILDAGADINWLGSQRQTALAEAVSAGKVEAVRLLIERGADVNARGQWARSPLAIAEEKGSVEIITLLVAAGATRDGVAREAQQETEKDSPARRAFAAVQTGDMAALTSLLDSGAVSVDERDAKDMMGPTLLMRAAEHGREEVARFLIGRGARVNAHTTFGGSALYYAAEKGHVGILKLLLDNGADVEANTMGATALFTSSKGHVEAIRTLLDYGADVNARERDGSTALWYAAAHGQADVVRLLLERGADPNLGRAFGETPLVAARRNGHQAVVEILKAA